MLRRKESVVEGDILAYLEPFFIHPCGIKSSMLEFPLTVIWSGSYVARCNAQLSFFFEMLRIRRSVSVRLGKGLLLLWILQAHTRFLPFSRFFFFSVYIIYSKTLKDYWISIRHGVTQVQFELFERGFDFDRWFMWNEQRGEVSRQ